MATGLVSDMTAAMHLLSAASSSVSPPEHRVRCEFETPGDCHHPAVFDSVYLRTNRTNHTKIMRCFPHCCPDHRKRSYCGSAILARVSLHKSEPPRRLSATEMVVYGRFRPHNELPMAVGQRIKQAAIDANLQSEDPSTGEWIESRYTRHGPSIANSWLFEINPSGRWYYPWSGAATIAMRGTEHVFEALVFRRTGGSDLELLARASSPTFRLMSFRRGANATATGSKNSPTAAGVDDTRPSPPREVHSTTRSPSPTMTSNSKAAQSQRPVGSSSRPYLTHQSSYSPVARAHSSHGHFAYAHAADYTRLSIPPSYQPPGAETRRKRPHDAVSPSFDYRTLTSAPQAAVSGANVLSTLQRWLHELPVSTVGSRSMLSWERTVQDACEAHLAAQRSGDRGRSGLVPILSVLSVSSSSAVSSSSFSPSVTGNLSAVSPLDTIDAAVRLFLHVWLSVDCSRASQDTVDGVVDDSFASGRAVLTSSYQRWHRDIEARAKRFVQHHTRVSWSHLAAKASKLDGDQSPGDADTAFGYRDFVSQWRERVARQHKRALRLKRQRATSTGDHITASKIWSCRMEDLSIEMDGLAQHSLSLLTVMQFWRHLSCLRLHFDRDQTLCVASVFNCSLPDGCFSKLTLDGQYRWLSCLPNGDATTGTSLMGFVVGDYVGRATSAGTIHVTTYLWPAAGSRDTVAYAWHWTIDASAIADDEQPAMVVSVIVERAPVTLGASAQFETMAAAEKLRALGRWTHVSQIQLAYRAY